MAKKQTFDKKLKKGLAQDKAVKVVFSYQAKDTGTWRFAEKIVKVPVDGDEAKLVEAEMKAGLEYIANAK
jgi:hypothetical protein